jgi:hypothetical protein
VELYDLAGDIGETRNLAEADPGKAGRMAEQLVAYLKEVNAEKPQFGPPKGKKPAKKGVVKPKAPAAE